MVNDVLYHWTTDAAFSTAVASGRPVHSTCADTGGTRVKFHCSCGPRVMGFGFLGQGFKPRVQGLRYLQQTLL